MSHVCSRVHVVDFVHDLAAGCVSHRFTPSLHHSLPTRVSAVVGGNAIILVIVCQIAPSILQKDLLTSLSTALVG
jgi:hypothetical protein